MLEVVAETVYSNDSIKKEDGGRRNEHVLRRLLEQLHTTMAIYHVWGSPFLGGGHLIKQHRDTRHKITGFVEKMQVRFLPNFSEYFCLHSYLESTKKVIKLQS